MLRQKQNNHPVDDDVHWRRLRQLKLGNQSDLQSRSSPALLKAWASVQFGSICSTSLIAHVCAEIRQTVARPSQTRAYGSELTTNNSNQLCLEIIAWPIHGR